MPSIFLFKNFWDCCSMVRAMALTQPTVGMIHTSLRIPTLPSSRAYPKKVSGKGAAACAACTAATGSYLYSSRLPKRLCTLWVCTQSPAAISAVALPIGNPYLSTGCPVAICASATLCPAGIAARVVMVTPPACSTSPLAKALTATATLSRG